MSYTKRYIESLGLRSLQNLQNDKVDFDYEYDIYKEELNRDRQEHLNKLRYYNELTEREFLERINYTKNQ